MSAPAPPHKSFRRRIPTQPRSEPAKQAPPHEDQREAFRGQSRRRNLDLHRSRQRFPSSLKMTKRIDHHIKSAIPISQIPRVRALRRRA